MQSVRQRVRTVKELCCLFSQFCRSVSLSLHELNERREGSRSDQSTFWMLPSFVERILTRSRGKAREKPGEEPDTTMRTGDNEREAGQVEEDAGREK
jgi:hypothetical protein